MSATLIEGVQIHPLKRIPDERGTIFHMLKKNDPHFIATWEATPFYRTS